MIELHTLQKVIDQSTVVDMESLHVEAGQIIALVGPAGSGKATLLDLLTGRTRPTVGAVTLQGLNPVADKNRLSRIIGVLFYEDCHYQHRTPWSNLIFHCQLRGIEKSRAEEIIQLVGIVDHTHANVEKLSGGLSRRLAFGRALLHEPSILLLVEPFARCDDASISLLSNLMRQMSAEGKTLLILAEDDSYLSPLCDTIHVLYKGRIIDSRDPSEEHEVDLPFKIPARLEGSVALVNPTDILYADAEEGRAFLNTTESRLPTQFTLAELEERLSRSGFFRAHRGYLVNLQHVTEVIPFTRNSFSLRLDNPEGTLIPLSKSAAGELRELLGY
jgi:ABC-2 type transport system ATP-binding protein